MAFGYEGEYVPQRAVYPMEDGPFFRLTEILQAWDEIEPPRGAPPLDPAELAELREQYAGSEFVLDVEQFGRLLGSFKQAEPLDAYEATLAFEACSADLASSMAADSGLLRPQRGREQIEAELRGFEEDYLRYFENPEHRQILRTTALLRTVLKPYTKHLTQQNWFDVIEPLMDKLGERLFAGVSSDAMRPEVQQVVRLFWKYDIVGRMQWGNYNAEAHEAMRATCPEEFRADLDDLVLVSYMCGASVHTKERWFTNRDVDRDSPHRRLVSTLPDDDKIQPQTGRSGTLNNIFRRSYAGAPLRLDVASRRRVSGYLNCTERVAELLDYYSEYRTLPGKVWSAKISIRMPGVYAAEVQSVLDDYTEQTGMPMNVLIDTNNETGEVTGLTWLRDPRPAGDDPSVEESDALVRRVVEDTEQTWRPSRRESPVFRGDAYACVGLVPGYDVEGKSIDNATKSAMTILSEYESEGIIWTTYQQLLHATWRHEGKVGNNVEEVLLIVGKLRDETVSIDRAISAFSEVAADLAQLRYYGGVMDLGRLSLREGEERTFAMGS
jgi:hypothetical protein